MLKWVLCKFRSSQMVWALAKVGSCGRKSYQVTLANQHYVTLFATTA